MRDLFTGCLRFVLVIALMAGAIVLGLNAHQNRAMQRAERDNERASHYPAAPRHTWEVNVVDYCKDFRVTDPQLCGY